MVVEVSESTGSIAVRSGGFGKSPVGSDIKSHSFSVRSACVDAVRFLV